MMAELGLFSLILAWCFSMLLVVVPSVGLYLNHSTAMKSIETYTFAQLLFVGLAFGCLSFCFLTDDFTVAYVLKNSSLALPWFYKCCAVWGGHEGSMLLWVLILSVWMMLVVRFSDSLATAFRVRVMVVLGLLSFGFMLFLLATSNPFLRQFTALSTSGRDLNPLLQDVGFLFHPPILYMGYVGFSVAFAFAIAGLWMKQVDAIQWARPWTLAAWCFLTLGITLGSWWAYRELGWGGWWFWDPVENASFMPWLTGTALIHSLMVTAKRQQFQAWTLLLAIMVFSLSLVGTFLVRSGVLTSVHAFAVDPTRGLFILIFLTIVIGGSLLLFLQRASSFANQQSWVFLSRESALLLNNIFLVVAMLTVLLGTMYPLIIDGLGLGKLSVGAPYFNAVFVPLMLPMVVVMGFGVHLSYKSNSWHTLGFTALMLVGCFVVSCSVFYFLDSLLQITVWVAVALALWLIVSTLSLLIVRIKRVGKIGFSFLGMVVAHCGVAVSMLGIAVSTGYGLHLDEKMSPGSVVHFAGFDVRYLQEEATKGSNYHGTRIGFAVGDGRHRINIYPEKRIYDVGSLVMTESAVDASVFRDVYIALGSPLDDDAWSVRLYYKPLVRWIWAGGLMMFLGGFLACFNRRNER